MSGMATEKGGHPPGLKTLFFTEMWERFAYYGMRAILVLFLTKHLHFDRADALQIYATYTAMVYLLPLLGGFMADHYLGQRKAVLIGGMMMALGQFALATQVLVNLGLALMIVGNGFFKPNISAMVGGLYGPNDKRQEGAFFIFYMGINLGAIFSPLVCGTLGEKVGWGYGFAAAGFGMIAGLLWFLYRQASLGETGLPPGRIEAGGGKELTRRDWRDIFTFVVTGSSAVAVAVGIWPYVSGIWTPAWMANSSLMVWAWRGLLILVLGLTARHFAPKSKQDDAPLTREEKLGLVVCGIATLAFFAFIVGFEQAGGTMNLFAEEKTRRVLFGITFPTSWFQSVNPVFIIVLTPIFDRLSRSIVHWPIQTKQGLGLLCMGVAFFVMSSAERAFAASGLVSPAFLIGTYFLATIAELSISPAGLAIVSKFSPKRMVSFMMAVFFLGPFAGNYVAGTLEAALKPYHLELWSFLTIFSVGLGLLWILSSLFERSWVPKRPAVE